MWLGREGSLGVDVGPDIIMSGFIWIEINFDFSKCCLNQGSFLLQGTRHSAPAQSSHCIEANFRLTPAAVSRPPQERPAPLAWESLWRGLHAQRSSIRWTVGSATVVEDSSQSRGELPGKEHVDTDNRGPRREITILWLKFNQQEKRCQQSEVSHLVMTAGRRGVDCGQDFSCWKWAGIFCFDIQWISSSTSTSATSKSLLLSSLPVGRVESRGMSSSILGFGVPSCLDSWIRIDSQENLNVCVFY